MSCSVLTTVSAQDRILLPKPEIFFFKSFFIVFVFGNFEKSLDGDRKKKKSKIKEIALKYTFS